MRVQAGTPALWLEEGWAVARARRCDHGGGAAAADGGAEAAEVQPGSAHRPEVRRRRVDGEPAVDPRALFAPSRTRHKNVCLPRKKRNPSL